MTKEIRELGSNSILVFVGNLFGKALELITVLIIGRLLGAKTFGDYAFIMSFISIVVLLPQLGMNIGLVSFISRENITKKAKQSYATFTLVLTLVVSSVFTLCLFFLRDYIIIKILGSFEFPYLFYSLLPLVILLPIHRIFKSILRANKEFKYNIIVGSFITPITRLITILVVVFLFGKTNHLALIISIYAYNVLVLIIESIKLFKNQYFGKILPELNHMRLVRYSLPLLFSGLIMVIIGNIDKYMIGIMGDSVQVGIYRIAIQVGGISTFALVAINTVLAPIVSQLFHNNKISELNLLYKMASNLGN